MPAPRILVVKLSSLGDVVHMLPAVTDLRGRWPQARVAWAVEAAYADLVRLHPGVDVAVPVALRDLRDHPLSPRAWRAFRAGRRQLRAERWDYVIDAQGLVKSALIARWSRASVFGPDAASARERLAARFYDVKVRVPRDMHAVERNRLLAARVLGYAVGSAVRYGIDAPQAPSWAPRGRYAVLLHAASRRDKRWPAERWAALAKLLADDGYAVVFPGGTVAERDAAARLAQSAGPAAMAAPAMTLVEAAGLLGHAAGAIGVDTGLTHLAVALGVPTVGLYCSTSPRLTGLHGDLCVNLGGRGTPPDLAAVAAAAGIGRAPA